MFITDRLRNDLFESSSLECYLKAPIIGICSNVDKISSLFGSSIFKNLRVGHFEGRFTERHG